MDCHECKRLKALCARLEPDYKFLLGRLAAHESSKESAEHDRLSAVLDEVQREWNAAKTELKRHRREAHGESD